MARILVIEDDEAYRLLLAKVLIEAGYDVVEAADGNEGLKAAWSKSPNLVITDLVMPGKEGIETITELRRSLPSTSVIAMSGAGHASTYLQLASKLGAHYALAKPFPRDALLAAVDKVLVERGPARAEDTVEREVEPRPFRFVVLDDDADIRFLHRCALTNAFPGCVVAECSSADEALGACKGAPVDAVLTDNQLGGPDGSSFVRAIRQELLRCPVLMVTGNSDPRVAERAYAAGATRVFGPEDTNFPRYLRTVLGDARRRS